jgi:signal peptidase I
LAHLSGSKGNNEDRGQRPTQIPGTEPHDRGTPPPGDEDLSPGETSKADAEVKSRGGSLRRFIIEVLVILGLAAVVAIIIQSFFIKAFIIPSSSMSPTLQIGDRVMVEKVTYYFTKPHRGDIIVFRYPPSDPKALNTNSVLYWPVQQIGETLHITHRGTTPYVKRVIGTGGDTVELRKGKLYVNGKRIQENYIVDDGSDYGPIKVPNGMLFCLGDNRPNSRDSRYWGMVPIRAVIGRVFLRWWPLRRFGSVPSP